MHFYLYKIIYVSGQFQVLEWIDYETNQANACVLIEASTLDKLHNLLEEKYFPQNILDVIVEKLRILLLVENNYQGKFDQSNFVYLQI